MLILHYMSMMVLQCDKLMSKFSLESFMLRCDLDEDNSEGLDGSGFEVKAHQVSSVELAFFVD